MTRIPDQSLVDDPGEATNRVQATRDGTLGQADATYILVYLSMLRGVVVDTRAIRSAQLRLWWYDPREGVALPLGTIANTGSYSARPPSTGPDWVLVIDDASASYPVPGSACWTEETR